MELSERMARAIKRSRLENKTDLPRENYAELSLEAKLARAALTRRLLLNDPNTSPDFRAQLEA